jgi:hypothetical protein
LLYGKLIAITVLFIIQNYAAQVAPVGKEISSDKLVKYLKIENRLHRAIRSDEVGTLLAFLDRDILLVCKQNRTRKTTFEQIREAFKQERCGKTPCSGLQMPSQWEIKKNMPGDGSLDAVYEKKVG